MPDRRTPIMRLMLLGLALLPFSTGTGSGLPVLSFGLPWLGLAAAMALPRLVRFKTHDVTELGAVFLGVMIVLLQFISCWIPEQPAPSLARWLPNAIGLILFMHIISHPQQHSPTLIQHLLRGLAWSATIMALYFLVNLAIGFAEDGVLVFLDRTNDGDMALPWGASNVIAATLLLGVIATRLLSLLDRKNRWLPHAIGLQSLAIIATMSRGATLLLLLFLGAQLILARHFRTLIVGLALLVALGGIFTLTQEDAADALAQTRGSTSELSTFNGRFDEWQEKSSYWLAHPLEPIGYYASPQTFVHTAHNVMLAYLVELGPIGALTLATFFLWLGRAIWQKMPRLNPGEQQIRRCCQLGWLVIGLNVQIEDPYYTQPYTITIWLLLAAWLKLSTRQTHSRETA